MSWRSLLQSSSDRLVMPWLGGRRVFGGGRVWRVAGDLPKEFGWYSFHTRGRIAEEPEQAEPDQDYGKGWPFYKGYLVGNWLIPEFSTPVPDDLFMNMGLQVYLIDPGLDRFTFVEVITNPDHETIYKQELFPIGPEDEVRRAFVDRAETVDHIKGVIPALDFAFRYATKQRKIVEERRAEEERRRQERERLEQARKNMGTGLGRRTLAAHDFITAAKSALAVGGAELLDVRPIGRNEMAVQYRVEGHRLECTVDKDTLRIVDAGICLEDHHTGEKGDTYFTLESLPAVVKQAERQGELVIWRRA